MMNKFKGRVAWIFGDHFDVDLITGVRHITEKDMNKLVDVFMKDFDPNFTREVRPGDFVVAGRNFGYGHPHPQAMLVMRHLGIRGIIARSFARVFFKNEVAYLRFLPLPCPDLPGYIKRWDEIEVDLDQWHMKYLSTGETFSFGKIPETEIDIIKSGGIVPYLKKSALPELSLDSQFQSRALKHLEMTAFLWKANFHF